MNSYSRFANIYDDLIHDDIHYNQWADYIENLFSIYDKNPTSIYELACGTGNITIPLAMRGYKITGIDISQDMINIAKSKDKNIRFLTKNILDLNVTKKSDAVLCMIDGLNYIISPTSLLKIFNKVRTQFLDENGIFIFDLSSQYKLKKVIGNNTFIHCKENIFYSWQNKYIDKYNISDMFLTFFVSNGQSYDRFEERHLQRGYSIPEISYLLNKAGFSKIDIYDELTFKKPRAKSNRVVFVCTL